ASSAARTLSSAARPRHSAHPSRCARTAGVAGSRRRSWVKSPHFIIVLVKRGGTKCGRNSLSGAPAVRDVAADRLYRSKRVLRPLWAQVRLIDLGGHSGRRSAVLSTSRSLRDRLNGPILELLPIRERREQRRHPPKGLGG